MEPTSTDIFSLISYILAGGSNAIIAILLLIVLAAIFVIRYLLKEVQRGRNDTTIANERYLKLLETYYESNSTVTEALNGVKMVLVEIKAKL